MLRWWRSLFAWKDVHFANGWIYRENSVTGERRAGYGNPRVCTPWNINRVWLKGGPWEPKRPSPPVGIR